MAEELHLRCLDVSPWPSPPRSRSRSPPPLQINYVRLMLLDEHGENVLMEDVDGVHWDLPYVVLPWGMNNDAMGCCLELQKQLGYTSEDALFTGIVEMLGEVGCMHMRGNSNETKMGCAKLMFVEPEPHAELHGMKDLPTRFAWKGRSFVSSIEHEDGFDESARFSYSVVKAALQGRETLQKLLPLPPFQPGWFQRSSAWLTEEVERLGYSATCHPIQYMLSHSSIIVAVDSTNGSFFLKGVVAGSRELEITAAVTRLFPTRTPDLVAINHELRAFITREFEERSAPESRMGLLKNLADMQMQSAAHVDELIASGVPSLRLDELEETLKRWSNDKAFIDAAGAGMSEFKSMVSELVRMGEELFKYNLPMCLVHGDFSKRNTGFKQLDDGCEHMILHDWQFAVIGHPFFEFHDVREDWDESIDVYLGMWGQYEDLERAREAYETAKVLGWLVKIMGTLECMRKGDVVEQFGASTTRGFFGQILLILETKVKTRAT